MSEHCVIVGAGHGAAQLCASLRQSGWEGAITLIGDEPFLPYHRPPLSKTQLDPKGETSLQLIRPEDFYRSNNIQTRLGERVDVIDREKKELQVGAEVISYDKLVLCLGSLHRRPPIPGVEHEKVHVLQKAQNAEALREMVKEGSRAVIIGGGFIGLEVAASLRKLDVEVTVVELAPRVLSRVTSPEVSAFFEKLHADKGVHLHVGASVNEISEGDEGLTLKTSDGKELSADFVVLGAGAAANTALAEAAGLDVENGILVDEFNQTSDSDIFALGDCCNQHRPLYQQRMRLESVQNAVDQAKSVALALNRKPEAHAAVPWFWSDQYDVKLQIVGVSTGYDRVVVRGTPEIGASFSAWYFRGDSLLAVDAVNDSIAYAVGTKILKSGLKLKPADVEDSTLETKQLLAKAKENSHV